MKYKPRLFLFRRLADFLLERRITAANDRFLYLIERHGLQACRAEYECLKRLRKMRSPEQCMRMEHNMLKKVGLR